MGGAIGSTAALTPTGSISGSFGISSSQIVSVDFVVPISGWNENQRAPTLVGSVTSNSSSALRIVGAFISRSGTTYSAINTGGDPWVSSVTRSSAGDTTVNFAAGTFSSAPTCVVTVAETGTRYCGSYGYSSSSSHRVQCFVNGTTPDDDTYSIMCMGPR